MNTSLNWLTDYVDVSMSAEELGDIFTNIGLNCDGIEETDSDIVFDLEVTSNRPDWLGHVGIARELSAAVGLKFTPPTVKELPTSGKVEDFTSIEVNEPELCSRYTARIIRNVKVGPSPSWLVERLEAVGMRSVNNIVDITNYILMEYSQPLHSFDYDKLAEGRIVVRKAKKGETLVSIDETNCELQESMLVIADAEKPVAIAGVMGGIDTEVTETTTNILLEAAQFDPLNIRHTSRTLGLMSESNYRFERGVDPVKLEEASLKACQMILELAGGELAEGLADVWATPFKPVTVELRPERTNKVLGMDVTAERQKEILDRLGLCPEMKDGKIVCTVPSSRADVYREIDLIEEVARLEGYNNIPYIHAVTHQVNPKAMPSRIREKIATIMSGSGFDETITFTFCDEKEAHLLGFDKTICVDPLVRKTNNTLRPSLQTSLLKVCKSNQDAGNNEVSLFEIASTFPVSKDNPNKPDEKVQIAMLTNRDFRDLRGSVELLFEKLCPGSKIEFNVKDISGFEAGCGVELILDGQYAGNIGIFSAEVLKYYGLEKPASGASILLEVLSSKVEMLSTYKPVPKYPPMRRDLSLIVSGDTTWGQLEEIIGSLTQPLLREVEYVTTYRGKPIPADKKSMTLTLTYRDDTQTLRSEQVDTEVNAVVDAMKAKLGAELRM